MSLSAAFSATLSAPRRLLRAAMPHHSLDLTLRRSPLLVVATALVALAVFLVHDSPPVSAQQTPITVNAGCTLAQAINEANGATQGVGSCAPGTDGAGAEGHDTIVLTGDVPSPIDPPKGCSFHPRCPMAMDVCREVTPVLKSTSEGHSVACHLY